MTDALGSGPEIVAVLAIKIRGEVKREIPLQSALSFLSTALIAAEGDPRAAEEALHEEIIRLMGRTH